MLLFPELLPLSAAAGGAYLHVKVTPKASQNRYGGLYTYQGISVLKVFVQAPPEKGQANDALIKMLAEDLGYVPSRLKVAQGHTTPLKKVFIPGKWEEIVQNVQNIL